MSRRSPRRSTVPSPLRPRPRKRAEPAAQRKESLIAADITIEGKIEGGGQCTHRRQLQGRCQRSGDLNIETGAKLSGSVRADNVTIAGELEGNVEEATRVELTQSAVRDRRREGRHR